jgi:hypothetical protein
MTAQILKKRAVKHAYNFVASWGESDEKQVSYDNYTMEGRQILFNGTKIFELEQAFCYSFHGTDKKSHKKIIKALINKGYKQVLSSEQIYNNVPQEFLY